MNFIHRLQSSIRKNWVFTLSVLAMLVVITGLLILTTRTTGLSSATNVDNNKEGAIDTQQVRGRQSDNVATSTMHATTSQSDNTTDIVTETQNTITSSNVDYITSDPFDVPLAAESVFVWDMESKQVLFEKDAETERPLASITKLMTALVASEMSEIEEQEVVIAQQHLEAYGNSGLVVNQSWVLRDLISFMLMTSANDAARAVASASSTSESDGYYAKAFIEQMNETAQNLGLESTYFFNPSGLDLNETLISGGYGTARDIAHLFAYIIDTNQEILIPTTKSTQVFESMDGLHHSARNTNTWLSRFDNILGSKTGYTVLAGGNLVMGFDLEHPVVIVVMGSTRNGRFQDMQTLYNATQQYFRSNPPTESAPAVN